MKMIKIFGVVVGIHLFALVLIFANPGCSSTKKADAARDQPEPGTGDGSGYARTSPVVYAPAHHAAGGPDSPIIAAPLAGGADSAAGPSGVRFSPTRPESPAATFTQATPASTEAFTTHTVVKGDSLWTIARKNKLTVAELAAVNNLKPTSHVVLGQKLVIPAKAAAASSALPKNGVAAAAPEPAPAAPRPSQDSLVHVVRPGETLGAIARKYQVTVGEIATANSIADPAKIRPGRELVIPVARGQAAKAAKSAVTLAPAGAPVKKASELPGESQPAGKPLFTLPAPDQDLDAGLNPAGSAPPVIKVEEPQP